MNFIKKNYGWIIVALLATLPLIVILKMINIDLVNGFTFAENTVEENTTTPAMLYHVSGEFAIRWMTAVLTLTPFYILFGVTNLFVRQAMGIATAFWSILHFIIFIGSEGLLATFTQANYIAGFAAILILVPLLFTSNRKSMKALKENWKRLQSLVYGAVLLSLLHIAILNKTWIIYTVIVGLGFIIRIPVIKTKLIERRKNKG